MYRALSTRFYEELRILSTVDREWCWNYMGNGLPTTDTQGKMFSPCSIPDIRAPLYRGMRETRSIHSRMEDSTQRNLRVCFSAGARGYSQVEALMPGGRLTGHAH